MSDISDLYQYIKDVFAGMAHELFPSLFKRWHNPSGILLHNDIIKVIKNPKHASDRKFSYKESESRFSEITYLGVYSDISNSVEDVDVPDTPVSFVFHFDIRDCNQHEYIVHTNGKSRFTINHLGNSFPRNNSYLFDLNKDQAVLLTNAEKDMIRDILAKVL